jgi:hypothetical protein
MRAGGIESNGGRGGEGGVGGLAIGGDIGSPSSALSNSSSLLSCLGEDVDIWKILLKLYKFAFY